MRRLSSRKNILGGLLGAACAAVWVTGCGAPAAVPAQAAPAAQERAAVQQTDAAAMSAELKSSDVLTVTKKETKLVSAHAEASKKLGDRLSGTYYGQDEGGLPRTAEITYRDGLMFLEVSDLAYWGGEIFPDEGFDPELETGAETLRLKGTMFRFSSFSNAGNYWDEGCKAELRRDASGELTVKIEDSNGTETIRVKAAAGGETAGEHEPVHHDTAFFEPYLDVQEELNPDYFGTYVGTARSENGNPVHLYLQLGEDRSITMLHKEAGVPVQMYTGGYGLGVQDPLVVVYITERFAYGSQPVENSFCAETEGTNLRITETPGQHVLLADIAEDSVLMHRVEDDTAKGAVYAEDGRTIVVQKSFSPEQLWGVWYLAKGEIEGDEWDPEDSHVASRLVFGSNGTVELDWIDDQIEGDEAISVANAEYELFHEPLYDGCANEDWCVEIPSNRAYRQVYAAVTGENELKLAMITDIGDAYPAVFIGTYTHDPSKYMMEMDWNANSRQSLRQVIFDSGKLAGAAYLKSCEGPIGDGLRGLLSDTGYAEDLPFIADIPWEDYIDAGGEDYFCVVPVDDDCVIEVSQNQKIGGREVPGDLLYRGEEGQPVVIRCDGSERAAHVRVQVIGSDGSKVGFNLVKGEKDGSPVVFNPGHLFEDFTITEE